MSSDWIEKQQEALAESENTVSGLKRSLTVEEIEMPSRPPSPVTVESLRKRRWRLVIALTVINSFCLLNGAIQTLTRPKSASLFLSGDQVSVTYDTEGNPFYHAKVPLDEFPYDAELGQDDGHDLLGYASGNLLLLIVILLSYRQQARLERMQIQRQTCPPSAAREDERRD